MPDYLDQVATWVHGLRPSTLPAAVVAYGKLVMLDTLTVILTGSRRIQVQKLAENLSHAQAMHTATIIGTTHSAPPHIAALVNGIAGTWEELDGGHAASKGHPAIHVIPAALALGEALHGSGEEVLLAVIAGYEIGARVGRASLLRESFHAHGTWGTIGAAVAASKLLGYNEQLVRETINVASALTLAAPYRTAVEGATVRNVYAGMANSAGLLAADLVGSGFTGQQDGPNDVFGSVSGRAFDAQRMIQNLGQEYEISRNYFKLYPCCRHTHACVEAVLKLRSKNDFELEELERIEVTTYDRAVQLCSSADAANELAAKFSIPFIVAQTFLYGQVTLDSFEPPALANSAARALARKVYVHEDPDFTARRPASRFARVEVCFGDGRRLSELAEINELEPPNPELLARVREKCFSLARDRLGVDRAKELNRLLNDFEQLEDVREVARVLSL